MSESAGPKLRTKIALVMSALIAAISIAIFVYLPERIEASVVDSMRESAHSLTGIAAHGLNEAAGTNQPTVTSPVLRALQQHPDVAWIVLRDDTGRVLNAFNPRLAESNDYANIPMAAWTPRPGQGFGRAGRTSLAPEGPGFRESGQYRFGRMQTREGFSADGRILQTVAPFFDGGRRAGDVYLGFSMERARAEIARGQRAAVILGMTILVLGIGGAILLSGIVTAPIRRIARATERIAAGERGERADVRSADEIGQLATSFNAMVDKLELAQAQLENVNVSLEQRVAERTSALREEVEERTRAESALRVSEEKYRMMVERNLAGVYAATMDGRILTANLACARMFGFDSAEEFVLEGTISYVDESQRREFLDALRRDGSITNFEVQLQTRQGAPIWALENAVAVEGRDLIEAILLDVTDRKRAELEIEYRAYHDPLTDLPNRNLFRDRLEVAVARARRHDKLLAVLFLDLDDLKGINDTLGHHIGDQVLQSVGERLRGVIRADDTVARIGGDEFAVVVSDLETQADVDVVAEKILTALHPPVQVNEEEVRVTASIGAALYPRDGEDPETLLRNADSTMYRIKERGGRGFRVFDQRDSSRGLRRSSLEKELRDGIERNEFVAYYQPQVDLETRELVGAEALVRWHHGEMVFQPAGFIALAEHTGLIIPIGEAVFRRVCADVRRWQLSGAPPIHVGVNFSPRQFHQRDLIGMLGAVVREAGIPPELLEVEITESMAVQKSGWTLRLIEQIRELGMRIGVDDFGTGRSSLVYLKNFPVDTVKIDRQFVHGMTRNPQDHSIVTAILLLAKRLNLRTVAEGVQTEDELQMLLELGCAQGQGFLFSTAVSAEQFEDLLFGRKAIEPADQTIAGS